MPTNILYFCLILVKDGGFIVLKKLFNRNDGGNNLRADSLVCDDIDGNGRLVWVRFCGNISPHFPLRNVELHKIHNKRVLRNRRNIDILFRIRTFRMHIPCNNNVFAHPSVRLHSLQMP